MLSLDKRPCLLGTSHGNFSLTGIMLERHELNRLLDDQGAWQCWFQERADGLPEPAAWTKHLRRFSHAEKFKGSQATIYVGAKDPIALPHVEISHVTLTPQIGGLTELSIICASRTAMTFVDGNVQLADVQLDIHTDCDLAAM